MRASVEGFEIPKCVKVREERVVQKWSGWTSFKYHRSYVFYSSTAQTVELLNDLYQHFDDCVDAYNVWKVETIGDAYLVASGVPDQHENHATEICKMSLDLLSKVSGII